MRILGLDIGTKRIGVALSDPFKTIGSSYGMIKVFKGDLEKVYEEVKNIVEKESVEAIVIGLPLHMNGDRGDKAELVTDFGEGLKNFVSVPIHYEDERLTTVTAEKALIEGEMRRKNRKEKIDSVAAGIILQQYLDKLNRKKEETSDE